MGIVPGAEIGPVNQWAFLGDPKPVIPPYPVKYFDTILPVPRTNPSSVLNGFSPLWNGKLPFHENPPYGLIMK
jgi:hypothetical protein